jgi:hypothetical protein
LEGHVEHRRRHNSFKTDRRLGGALSDPNLRNEIVGRRAVRKEDLLRSVAARTRISLAIERQNAAKALKLDRTGSGKLRNRPVSTACSAKV